eukprot:1005158_1
MDDFSRLNSMNWFMENMVGDVDKPEYDEQLEAAKPMEIVHRPETHTLHASYSTSSYTDTNLTQTKCDILIKTRNRISNCKCNKCIHSHYENPEDFIIHLLFSLNYINYNTSSANNSGTPHKIMKRHLKFLQNGIGSHFICVNCMNLLFENDHYQQQYLSVLIEMLKNLRNVMNGFTGTLGNEEDLLQNAFALSLEILYELFQFRGFLKLFVQDFDLFDMFCKIWYQMSFVVVQMISDGSPGLCTDATGSIFMLFTYFFISIKYWNRRHLIYFVYYFYNGFMDQIGKKLFL